MITIIIAVLFGGGVFAGCFWGLDWGPGWSVFTGLVGFGVFQGLTGWLLQKRVKQDMEGVQLILKAGQAKLQEKTRRWQMRPPSSIKAAQKEMFEDTKLFVKEAIRQTEVLRKYRWVVPMIDRQMATAQLQLYWMIKEFRKVDDLMPKALLVDPVMVAMKMARLYMREVEKSGGGGEMDLKDIEKLYRKGVSRVRYNGNVLLAGLMSWIYVQKNRVDDAFKCLTEALKKSDDATLKRNHEMLMNNKVAHFNNSGLGDAWYSLYLEEPKVHTQRQHIQYR